MRWFIILLIFMSGFVSAGIEGIIGLDLNKDTSIIQNVSYSNCSMNWNTTDHGVLEAVSDILTSWLTHDYFKVLSVEGDAEFGTGEDYAILDLGSYVSIGSEENIDEHTSAFINSEGDIDFYIGAESKLNFRNSDGDTGAFIEGDDGKFYFRNGYYVGDDDQAYIDDLGNFVTSVNVTVENTLFTDNISSVSGGGIKFHDDIDTPDIMTDGFTISKFGSITLGTVFGMPNPGQSITASNVLSFAGTSFRFGNDIDLLNHNIGSISNLTSDKIATGSNTLNSLSSGDINVSTVFYDVLTAKSPIVMCSDNWCSINFPKYQKTLWINKNEAWGLNEIIYEETSYNFSDFDKKICKKELSMKYVCEEFYKKINYLKDKKIKSNQKELCLSLGYVWEGECYNIERVNKTYNQVINIIKVDEEINIKEDCVIVDENTLEEKNSKCVKKIKTGSKKNVYGFKEGCGWDQGYYCEIKNVVTFE